MKPFNGPIFLSVKDLMLLMGTTRYETARVRHRAIRDAIDPGKSSLTIREFCDHEGLPFDEIWRSLRG